MVTVDIWTYRQQAEGSPDLIGYDVEALDGGIGTVDEASNEVNASYVVVDTGHWIFGKKVVLPAGVVSRVDVVNDRLYVNRTKDQVKNAPEFDPDAYREEPYLARVGAYYGPEGTGWQE